MDDQWYVPADDLVTDAIVQEVMWAYIDAAQAPGHAHDRLVHASRDAARAALTKIQEDGYVVRRRGRVREPSHGTGGGYKAGCRCEFCTEAYNLVARARYYWKRVQGDNKVR